MKVCKICTQSAPYDPDAPRGSKASGFQGNVCWACFVEAQRKRAQSTSGSADALYIELKAQRDSLKAQIVELERKMTYAKLEAKDQARNMQVPKAKPVHASSGPALNVPYGLLEAKAQEALNVLEQGYPEPRSPEVEARRAQLKYNLARIQHKVKLFGPNAYDFTPARNSDD